MALRRGSFSPLLPDNLCQTLRTRWLSHGKIFYRDLPGVGAGAGHGHRRTGPTARRGVAFLKGMTPCTGATGAASQNLSSCISRPAITVASSTVLRQGCRASTLARKGAQNPARIRADSDLFQSLDCRRALREAVAQFAEQESQQVRAYQREAATLLPFKQESAQP